MEKIDIYFLCFVKKYLCSRHAQQQKKGGIWGHRLAFCFGQGVLQKSLCKFITHIHVMCIAKTKSVTFFFLVNLKTIRTHGFSEFNKRKPPACFLVYFFIDFLTYSYSITSSGISTLNFGPNM